MFDSWFQKAAQHKNFWKIRGLFEKAKFYLTVRRYTSIRKVADTKSNLKIWWYLVKNNLLAFSLSVLTVILLHYLDPIILGHENSFSFYRASDTDYISFLATVSGIGGIFIGLYFTAVMNAASVVYANVHSDIRNLLVKEKYGNIYMQFLAYISAVSLILIAIVLMGLPKPIIAIPFIVILCAIWILGFLGAGQRTFYFFDPSELSPYIFRKNYQALNSVIAGGNSWHRLELQNTARNIIDGNFAAITSLAKTCRKSDHLNDRSYKSIIDNTFVSMSYFLSIKRGIPTASGFFADKFIHKDWYGTNGSVLHIAAASKTLLSPEIIKDHNWLEQKTNKIL